MKVNRNQPCPCGSGKKYKHCCYAKDTAKQETVVVVDAETKDVPAEAAETGSDESRPKVDTPLPNRDRTRFQGDARGGGSRFRPRATGGAQRGS